MKLNFQAINAKLWEVRNILVLKVSLGASLVVQWLRICLPMQGTLVRALVQEDPTCRRAACATCQHKPVRHNYWACALDLVSHNYWACVPQLLSSRATTTEARVPRPCAPQQEKPPQWEACASQQSSPCLQELEKARTQQPRPDTAENK